eukprot:1143845-Pelagomonas_calceolata.AAC.7
MGGSFLNARGRTASVGGLRALPVWTVSVVLRGLGCVGVETWAWRCVSLLGVCACWVAPLLVNPVEWAS